MVKNQEMVEILNTHKSLEILNSSVDFLLSPGANSGIKYFVKSNLNKSPGSAIGLEFQILDDAKHPDANLGKNGNRTVGSLYDLIRQKTKAPAREVKISKV